MYPVPVSWEGNELLRFLDRTVNVLKCCCIAGHFHSGVLESGPGGHSKNCSFWHFLGGFALFFCLGGYHSPTMSQFWLYHTKILNAFFPQRLWLYYLALSKVLQLLLKLKPQCQHCGFKQIIVKKVHTWSHRARFKSSGPFHSEPQKSTSNFHTLIYRLYNHCFYFNVLKSNGKTMWQTV